MSLFTPKRSLRVVLTGHCVDYKTLRELALNGSLACGSESVFRPGALAGLSAAVAARWNTLETCWRY